MMNIGVFASGDGSNFEALALSVSVAFVVCDQSSAGVLKRAERLGVKVYLIARLPGEKRQAHENRIWEAIKEEDINLICLAGWQRVLSPQFLARFPAGSILNIHPSLLPLHPGLHGYEDTFAAGSELGGITVHEVDAGVDTGRILAQKTFPRLASDDLASFKSRGLALEHELYPQVVAQVLTRFFYHRIEVLPAARELLGDPERLCGRLLWLKTQSPCAMLGQQASKAFADPVSERLFWSADASYERHLTKLGFSLTCQERGFLPGVTDNPAMAGAEAWLLATGMPAQVRSGESWRGAGGFPIANPLLTWEKTVTDPFKEIPWREVRVKSAPVRNITLPEDDHELLELNRQSWWALTLPELQLVREFFTQRGTPATDVEMEIIAQTWSEHCKHKIFRAHITFEHGGQQSTIKSLFKTYIQGVTQRIQEERGLTWLVSVFDDNAGVVRWDDRLDVAIKVETHNSPSALDPYGGALTGILGVNRDILGVGMGARPVANTNVFCLAPPQLSERLGEAWPPTLLAPEEIRRGVHAGVKDGGNKSGIPTVNGAFHYDVNFAGKPLVFCGTLGVMPHEVQGRPSALKPISVRDHVVMVGGRIGKDGLHGATFSSMEWKEGTPASVVQIGDPLTQKRLTDFLLEARDLGLYSGLTDNGAGGLSSSIGEMALFTGGAEIDLARAPVKYPGLSAWELMVSESQERMTVAVPPAKLEDFYHLAQLRGVEATSLGTFTSHGELHVRFDGQSVARLPLNFLHEGLPPMQLRARWDNTLAWQDWCENPWPQKPLPLKPSPSSLVEVVTTLLGHENIRSHEKWVRQYDHEVQAASATKPFAPQGLPADAGVIALKPHGGNAQHGIAVGCGLAPQISRFDPYLMGVWAVDEAVRNVLCAGGDPARMALVDNFCWPDPILSEKNLEGDVRLGMLVRTCQGMADACLAFGLPLVSGKDSMKNDAMVQVKGVPVKISALPTLLMTCFALVPQIDKVLPSAPREAGLLVVRVSALSPLSAITLAQVFQVTTPAPQMPVLESLHQQYQRFHQALKDDLFMSAHDVSEGGVMIALAEQALGDIGFKLDVAGGWTELFGEGPGQIVVTLRPENWSQLLKYFPVEQLSRLGQTVLGGGIEIMGEKIPQQTLKRAYQETL